MTVATFERRVVMADVDHVMAFYGRYFDWMDSALADLLRALGHPLEDLLAAEVGLPLVDARCQFERQVRLGDLVRIDASVVRTGRTSVLIGYVFSVDGVKVAQGRTTHVWMARTGPARSEPVPDWLRDAEMLPVDYRDEP